MPTNPELILQVRPVGGEPFSVRTAGFASTEEALAAVRQALEQPGGLVVSETAGDGDETGASVTLVNLANVVSVHLTHSGSVDRQGQYL